MPVAFEFWVSLIVALSLVVSIVAIIALCETNSMMKRHCYTFYEHIDRLLTIEKEREAVLDALTDIMRKMKVEENADK